MVSDFTVSVLRLATSPYLCFAWRLHRICASLGDFTVSVLRLATSPYLCFAWRLHHICASLGDFTVFVLRLATSPYLCLAWRLHRICAKLIATKVSRICTYGAASTFTQPCSLIWLTTRKYVIFKSLYRDSSVAWSRSMDTGIGDKENTGWHLHLATKVYTRGQM